MIIIGFLLYDLIFGIITSHVAHSKGYDHGFAWGFFLGIIGLLVVGFKPNINESHSLYEYNKKHPSYNSRNNTEQLSPIRSSNTLSGEWICICGNHNSTSLSSCTNCRRNKQEGFYAPRITCPSCGRQTLKDRTNCIHCANLLPKKESISNNEIEMPTVISKDKASEIAASSFPSKSVGNPKESKVLSQDSILDLLEKLSKMREQNIITEEEFQTKKRDLLQRL